MGLQRVGHDWATFIGLTLSSLTLSTVPGFNLLHCCCHLVTQPCSTLCDPKDYSLPGFSVQGISQARILEWIAIAFCRASFWSRERTCISYIGRQIHYCWATKEARIPALKLTSSLTFIMCLLTNILLKITLRRKKRILFRLSWGLEPRRQTLRSSETC